MVKLICRLFIFTLIFSFTLPMFIHSVEARNVDPLILDNSTKRLDMYPSIEVIKDREMELTINDVVADDFTDKFTPINEIKQKRGFFETANWLRFEISNQSAQDDWLLEFSFPVINDLQIYVKENKSIKLLYESGSDLPFNQREIDHRYFITNLEIKPGESMTFFALAVGSGDLHPP